MDLFLSLLFNIFPLYILIGLGFIAGRFFEVDRKTLANLVIFIVVPVVAFGYIAQIDMKPAYILLPLLYFTFLVVMGLGFFKLGQCVYGDSRANLLSLSTAQSNSGYFGLPVMIFLFEPQWVALYMFINLAGLIYEATFAYYIAARGAYDVKESLRKVLAYPTLYAVIFGFGMNAAHVELPDLFLTYWGYFKGAYVVMGMMILGVALSALHRFEFSLRYNALVFLGKFMVWPLLMGAFVVLDIVLFKLYGPEIHTMLMLLSIMPPAANVTAFATQFNTNPEKAATTVLAGTLFALIAIPLVLVLTAMR